MTGQRQLSMRQELGRPVDELLEGTSLLAGPAIGGGAIALVVIENTSG